jgi:hypothetical protein
MIYNDNGIKDNGNNEIWKDLDLFIPPKIGQHDIPTISITEKLLLYLNRPLMDIINPLNLNILYVTLHYSKYNHAIAMKFNQEKNRIDYKLKRNSRLGKNLNFWQGINIKSFMERYNINVDEIIGKYNPEFIELNQKKYVILFINNNIDKSLKNISRVIK